MCNGGSGVGGMGDLSVAFASSCVPFPVASARYDLAPRRLNDGLPESTTDLGKAGKDDAGHDAAPETGTAPHRGTAVTTTAAATKETASRDAASQEAASRARSTPGQLRLQLVAVMAVSLIWGVIARLAAGDRIGASRCSQPCQRRPVSM